MLNALIDRVRHSAARGRLAKDSLAQASSAIAVRISTVLRREHCEEGHRHTTLCCVHVLALPVGSRFYAPSKASLIQPDGDEIINA